jgi:hypothetical protein
VRYRCLECGKTFVSQRRAKWVSRKKEVELQKWFRLYILKGLTYDVISGLSGLSIRSLEKNFHEQLEKYPPVFKISPHIIKQADRPTYLLIDGKWWGKTSVDMLYRLVDIKAIIHHSFLKREYASQIERDLRYIVDELGYSNIHAVISDGGPGIRKAVLKVFGHIPHQICLAHVSREITRCLGKFPQADNLQLLKSLANHM